MSRSDRLSRYPVPLGVALGLLGAALLLAAIDRGPAEGVGKQDAALLSECEGTLRELVLHYADEAREAVVADLPGFPPTVCPAA